MREGKAPPVNEVSVARIKNEGQCNHRDTGYRTKTVESDPEDRKKQVLTQETDGTAVALGFHLTALFLYRTGQLYLERKALSVKRSSGTACRQGTPRQNRTGEWNIRGRATGAIHI